MRSALVVLGSALLLAACSDNPASGGCTSNNECNSGEVCDSGTCILVCSSDLQCDAGEICVDSLCQPGDRADPTITAFDGDGSMICPDANGTHCMAAGILIQGTNLEGAAFSLTPQSGGTSHPLNVRAGATDGAATVDLPDVAPGMYVLTAANQVGSADQALQLLQGPPGEDFSPTAAQLVTMINGSSETILSARLAVGTGPNDVAAGQHDHDAAALVSGTIDAARLPAHTHGFGDLTGSLGFSDLTGTATFDQLPVGWTPIAKQASSLASFEFSGGTLTSFTLPTSVPTEAREVLIYARVRNGNSTSDSDLEFRIYTQEGATEYSKYMYMHTYPQAAYAYNSSQWWLPVTSNRTVYINREIGSVPTGCSSGIFVTGYR